MPAVGDLVELGEQQLWYLGGIVDRDGVGELPSATMAGVPCGQASAREPLGSRGVLSPECAESTAQSAGTVAPTMRNREERARVAARGELTEDATCDLEVPFDDEVHYVVREPGS
jgi:hypothetical protein